VDLNETMKINLWQGSWWK